MQRYFENQVSCFNSIVSDAELRLNIISQIRLLLQQVDYSLLEWVSKKRPNPDCQPTKEIIDSLRQPADGALVDALDALLISCDQLGWSGSSRVLLKTIPSDNPAMDLISQHSPNLHGLLKSIVELRNQGAEGHGLPGGYRRNAEISAYEFIMTELTEFVPKLDEKQKPFIISDTETVAIDMLPPILNGRPQLIRKIKIINSKLIRLETQAWDGKNDRQNHVIEKINIFNNLEGSSLPSYTVWDSSWEPLCYIPERAEIFSGRHKELDSLFEWANDSDSWACLVFGDGGLGKTSLVIEFIHKMLDDDPRAEWKPKAISFYTAKKIQWGINGLEKIKSGQPHLSELVRHLYVLNVGTVPPTEYYRKDIFSTAQMLRTKISESENNISRNEHLIIIDNAETLIENEDDHAKLGKELKEITKRLGRVLVTSRRHELFEANPISVGSFSQNETLGFIRERGKKLNLRNIEKASNEELINATSKMDNRPLVLEVFILTLTDPSFKTLEKAKNKVEGMLQRDLGEFLFADAWSRFSIEIKKLLLLITSIADVCDGHLFKICANIYKISLVDAERSLEESKGIGSISNINGNFQIIFSTNFLQFAEGQRTQKTGAAKIIHDVDTGTARTKYNAIIEATQKFSGDRIINAFRTPIAKAAHRARQKGDLQEALRLYEQAILADKNNGWLYDRYAYFLFYDMRNMEAALIRSKIAVSLLPDEGEVWFTRGLIESRLGDIRATEKSLEKAESFGTPRIRCDLQRCWAYLKAKPVQIALAKSKLASLESQAKNSLLASRVEIEINRLKNRLAEIESKLTIQ